MISRLHRLYRALLPFPAADAGVPGLSRRASTHLTAAYETRRLAQIRKAQAMFEGKS